MKTLLPSGVSMYPVLATRLKVWVSPETVPGVQTMPSLAALAGSAAAGPWASTADPATSTRARTRPSRRVLCRMVAFLPRCSDIGLAHHRLGRQRVLVHPHLGHHCAWRPAGSAAVAQQRGVLADDVHRDAGQLHRMLLVAEVGKPQQHPFPRVHLHQ